MAAAESWVPETIMGVFENAQILPLLPCEGQTWVFHDSESVANSYFASDMQIRFASSPL